MDYSDVLSTPFGYTTKVITAGTLQVGVAHVYSVFLIGDSSASLSFFTRFVGGSRKVYYGYNAAISRPEVQ